MLQEFVGKRAFGWVHTAPLMNVSAFVDIAKKHSIYVHLPPKHASRMNTRNIIDKNSFPMLANQDLMPRLV